jgi:hypothetical protein
MQPAAVAIANATYGYRSVGSDTWTEGLWRTLNKLERAGLRITVIQNIPRPGIDVLTCLARADGKKGGEEKCNASRQMAVDEGFLRAERAAASRLHGVNVVDVTQYFCDAAVCPSKLNGIIVYRDGSHMTEHYALTLSNVFADALAPVIRQHRGIN